MKTDVPLQLRIGGVVLLCLGPLLALMATGLYLQSKQMQNWPSVDARVIRSEIEVSKKAGGLRRGKTSFHDYYTAVIQYEYAVQAQRYTGNRIAMDASRSSGFDREHAERWIQRYPVGSSVSIHYSSHRPEQSVIDPSADTGLLGLVAGLGFLAIPVGLVLRRIARHMQPVRPPAAAALCGPAELARPSLDTSCPPLSAAPSRHPELMNKVGLRTSRPIHWLIRVISVSTGLVLFIVGSMALFVSIRLFLTEEDAPVHAAIRITVHLVMMSIMGGITLLGGLLLWKGMKRTGRSNRCER